MKEFNMLMLDKSASKLGNFIGRRVQKTTGLFMEKGLDLAETSTLLILQSSARNPGVRRFVHSVAPPISQIFATVRKSSPVLPFMAGMIARKSALIGIRIALQSLKLSRRAIMIMCGRTRN
jgi:hypothetical protein